MSESNPGPMFQQSGGLKKGNKVVALYIVRSHLWQRNVRSISCVVIAVYFDSLDIPWWILYRCARVLIAVDLSLM